MLDHVTSWIVGNLTLGITSGSPVICPEYALFGNDLSGSTSRSGFGVAKRVRC